MGIEDRQVVDAVQGVWEEVRLSWEMGYLRGYTLGGDESVLRSTVVMSAHICDPMKDTKPHTLNWRTMGQLLNKAAINVFFPKSLKIKSTHYSFPEGASSTDASRERVSGRTPGPIKPQMTPANCTWQFAVTHWSHGTLCAQRRSREFTVHFVDDTLEQAKRGS